MIAARTPKNGLSQDVIKYYGLLFQYNSGFVSTLSLFLLLLYISHTSIL